MESDIKTNMKEFQKKVQEYGGRLTKQGIERAAVDLSMRAENAVKRDFINYLKQTPSQGEEGRTVRSAHLKAEVHAVVKNQYQFGLGSNLPYAGPHERGTGPYVIRPREKKALKFIKGDKVVFAKRVMHPGQKARHWMSEPMQKELTKYIDDQISKLEQPL